VKSREELDPVAATLRRHLEWRQGAGLDRLPRPARRESAPAEKPPPRIAGFATHLFGDYAAAEAASSLEELREAIGDCRRCKLWSGRTHLVFGVGHPRAEVMFIGEGPGRDEDLQGEPFVGRAGQLLTDIITKGMGLRREDVYIANVIKCRPPENRDPEPDEIDACEPFLLRQIELVRPRVIVALGKFAVQTLLKTKVPIMRLRGNWHAYHGIKLMPTLHPAYLLRNPGDKKLVWQDIKKVIEELRGVPA
jgi:uracil-DNA glycosylase family 4